MNGAEVWIAGAIFLGVYLLIATEIVHKTAAALAGGVLMIAFHILEQEEAFAAIDFNVIFLLLGMMVIANVMRGTGVFQWVAIRSIRLAGNDPWRIMIVLCLITAVASAFLDNVTTVVLIAPVTLYIAAALGVSAVPYLIAEILASNIGGMATLIGDPPNILIGSAAGIDFATFAWHMTPISVLSLAAFFVFARFAFARELAEHRERMSSIDLDEGGVISEPRLMALSVTVLLVTVVGFVLAAPLGYEPATVALLGASVLLVAGRIDPAEVLARVEWSTLLFFVGLFMAVEGIIHVGIISGLATALFDATGGEPFSTSLALLWVSGVASGVVDNIPYTATVIPIVEGLGARGADVEPLWWALAMGADLGGNATIIGASANVVIASLAARAGQNISFSRFLRYGIPMVVISLFISTIYLIVRYLL